MAVPAAAGDVLAVQLPATGGFHAHPTKTLDPSGLAAASRVWGLAVTEAGPPSGATGIRLAVAAGMLIGGAEPGSPAGSSGEQLQSLLASLSRLGYRFTAVTPDTHALVLARDGQEGARSLRDVFGWNRAFSPNILPAGLFEEMQRAGACEELAPGRWRATLRVASIEHFLFAHSPFPTVAQDAVFFGPDSYRFARAIRKLGASATRAVDIGCGSGVGGVMLSHYGALASPVVLADINEHALGLARVNAHAAGVVVELAKSDVLQQVDGALDLVIANPPYLVDPAARAYRNGGGHHGAELSARIAREALLRLSRHGGGTLLLYTGSAIVNGLDSFFELVRTDLRDSESTFLYEELDPDIFASELREPAYADTERIAAVLLQAQVGDARSRRR